MHVESLELKGYRSFVEAGPIKFEKINVLTGANNSGKSSILKALNVLQLANHFYQADIRSDSNISFIKIVLGAISDSRHLRRHKEKERVLITKDLFRTQESDLRVSSIPSVADVELKKIDIFPSTYPDNFIVPYLSKRKTASFQETVNQGNANLITSDFQHLASKLANISNPNHPFYEVYYKTCKQILGFLVTPVTTVNGQKPGVILPIGGGEILTIEQMGEGVPNIVSLLVELALSKGKLFLIEEPENDLHPTALKALLDLIVESSKYNQFVISTHSHIVVKHLGAIENSKLFNIKSEFGQLPTISTITEVETSPSARLAVLQELGYTLSDFDLWDGWLILEESSAERVVRDYLIPWFAPKMSRVRTLSANGVTNLEATFEDFNRLVRFTHLEPVYKNKAWVYADGDSSGLQAVDKLKKTYISWDESHFTNFQQEQFEYYYPDRFKEEVVTVLGVKDKQAKREAKRLLLNKVLDWIKSDEERAKVALSVSAKEIIDCLKQIEQTL